jgi:hypothetical protein
VALNFFQFAKTIKHKRKSMKETQRELPEHLTENTSSKCFVFRRQDFSNGKLVPFSYARGKDRETEKSKAIAYTNRMNKALGPAPRTSPEGRMSSRNKSGIVRVNPKRTSPRGQPYYFWVAKWKGCPKSGGVPWPCLTWGDNEAYVLAALTLTMRTVERSRVIEEFEKIRGTPKYREYLRTRPKIPIKELWPD